MTQGIDRVYRQCDPAKPLEPNDPRYVSCEGLRGTGDLVGRNARPSSFGHRQVFRCLLRR